MKTAISLPDDLYTQADRWAKQCGISRSELYARAVREYLQRHSREGLTERINEAIRRLDSSLPPDLNAAARATFRRNEWCE